MIPDPLPIPAPAARWTRAALATIALALVSLAFADGWASAWKEAGRQLEDRNFKSALAQFEKVASAKDAPEEKRIHATYNMGACHAMLGNKAKALELVTKAIEMGFDNAELLASDPNIKSIRNDKKITDAAARLREKREAAKLAKAREDIDAFKASYALEFSLPTVDGKEISTKALLGKVVIVDLWGTWCPPCRAEIPHFIELSKKLQGKDFAMVGLNYEHHLSNGSKPPENPPANALKEVKAFAAEMKIPYPLALLDDATYAKIPNVRGFPTTLFLDRAGKVRLQLVGYRELEEIEAYVAALLAEGAPAAPESRKAK